MVLAKDEEVVKEWVYATSTLRLVETKHSLTVTNKRIIAKSDSSRKKECNEIALADVKSISGVHETPSKIWAIILMVLGGLFVLVPLCIKLFDDDTDLSAAQMILFWVVGAFLLYCGYKKLKQGLFTLIIRTKGMEGTPFSLTAFQMMRAFSIFHLFSRVKVEVKHEIADEILDTIGMLTMQ